MFILNKILPVFVLPLGGVLLLVLFAWWRKKRWPVAAAVILLYLASIPLVGGRLIGWLESRYPAVPLAQAGPADAVIVLGGILGPKTAPGMTVNWSESVERFEAGVALLQGGRAGRLVFTGARMPWEKRATLEGEDLRELAIARGVAPEKILVTAEISNTAGEARAVADLVRQRGWRRVILVTTAWHMPRSARLFQQAGVECVLFPVDFRQDRDRSLTMLDFLPNAGALSETETALRECYGNLFYRIFR